MAFFSQAEAVGAAVYEPRAASRFQPRERAGDMADGNIALAGGCAYRKSNPNILVVQSAEDGAAENVAGAMIDGARDRRILFQG
jgi:hypothetical protein